MEQKVISTLNSVHPLNEMAWQEWKEYRSREIRKKIGPIAERKQVAMLCGYPPPIQQQIIDQSIMNSWQGLFPPKQQHQPQTRQTSLTQDLTDISWAL